MSSISLTVTPVILKTSSLNFPSLKQPAIISNSHLYPLYNNRFYYIMQTPESQQEFLQSEYSIKQSPYTSMVFAAQSSQSKDLRRRKEEKEERRRRRRRRCQTRRRRCQTYTFDKFNLPSISFSLAPLNLYMTLLIYSKIIQDYS